MSSKPVTNDEPVDLGLFVRRAHSQYGEDGILRELFERKGIKHGYFCEFGAWDGQHLSNTYAMYENGWSGCYIEGLAERFEDLKRNITREEMALVCAFVRASGEDTLDNILDRSLPSGTPLDLLSIDIDSDDLAIWESVQRHRAKVVIIEFNPTIPIDVRYKNAPGKNRGNSPLSIYEFATSQDYELVAATHCNLIFADRAFNNGQFRTLTLQDLGANRGYRYFFGYDGTLMQVDPSTGGDVIEREFYVVPWSNTVFPQPIPRAFRKFAEGSLPWKISGVLSRVAAVASRPITALKRR
ncbi:hypothetical protein [Sphingomonas psychrotolerans]|uniref:Methyltransferase FkbM domain-containing protein n=1 Tax=Sphingomonas psychrotolerans TaxID=1327635 RepID=A0A2K8MND9_9SPHN|nr:hypothetical protein [Sphingomonas psychrotolerans]ATY34256.1 hypothetical protein CVN68_21730 [Sphingomonas psychrotolerans]